MTAAAAPVATDAPSPLPRWLPAALLALTILPLHPYWFDFEQVRRGLVMLLVGVLLLWRALPVSLPRWVLITGLAFLGCNTLSWLLHLDVGVAAGLLRLGWLFALGAVLRLGAALPRLPLLLATTALLAMTSTFGLLQRLGVAALGGYGTLAEPVSVFGNLNVAAEFTTVAAIAALLLWPQRRALAAAALLLAGAYLAVNGTRAALVALPFGILWLGWQAPATRRGTLLGSATMLLGFGAGLLLAHAAPAPMVPEPDAAAQPFAQQRYAASLPLRVEIAKGALAMAADAPLCGVGPGHFQIEYPRYRRQQEIEISSYGRQFATKVSAAHDDWLEVLVDGGAPALLSLALLVVLLLRHGGALAAPLCAFAVLMLARAPLGNAPAAAVALLLAGSGLAGHARSGSGPGGGNLAGGGFPGTVAPAARAWPRWAMRLLALPLLALGSMTVVGNSCFTGYQGPRAHDLPGDLPSLQDAAAWQPWEPAYWQLLAQEYELRQPPDLPRALAAADRLLALRPYEPTFHLLRAEIVLQGGDTAAAKAEAIAALKVDAGNPEARVLLSAIYFREHNHVAAARIVYEEPHPRLRAQLPQHFRSLEQLALQRGENEAAARYAAERSLLTVLPLLGKTDAASRARAKLLGPQMMRNFTAAGMTKDVRPLAAAALLGLDVGDDALAQQYGAAAAKLGVAFEPWQRLLFGEQLQRLQAVPQWQAVLARR